MLVFARSEGNHPKVKVSSFRKILWSETNVHGFLDWLRTCGRLGDAGAYLC